MLEEAQLKAEQEMDAAGANLRHRVQSKSSKNLMKLINSTIKKNE